MLERHLQPVLESAQADAEGLLAALPSRAVIDEVQRAPGLLLAMKAASTATSPDFDGLRAQAETAGKAFVQGVVLYLGRASVPFGPHLTALPLDSLWTPGPAQRFA